MHHPPSTYLLLAIERKGGVQWAQAAPTRVALPAPATPGLGFTAFKPILAFFVFWKWDCSARGVLVDFRTTGARGSQVG